MKLQIENNSSSNFLDNPGLSSDVSSANGSAEVTEMLSRGIKAAQNGNRAEARHLLLQATELEPKNENAWLWLASISEYPEELLIFLSNVLSVNPQNERALEWEKSTKSLLSKTFVQRGIEASKDSQSAFAKQCFLQAIVHDDKNEMAWLWLASISEVIEEKKSHLQKVLTINPNNEMALTSLKSVKNEMAQTLLRKAQVETLSGAREAAEKMLGDILAHAPELEDAWLLKSYLTDSFSEKMSFFEKVLKINPENETAASCQAAMRSVLEKTEPKPDSDAVKYFDFTAPAVQEESPEDSADVLDLNISDETEVPEMTGESFDETETDEDISVENYYTTEEIAEAPTQDYTFPEDSVQEVEAIEAVEAVEEVEESSFLRVESVEEVFEMQAEVFEEPEVSHDEESEMHLAFSEVPETEESIFEEIQYNVAAVELTQESEEVYTVSEMPSYQEVIEEEQSYREEQKAEENTIEFHYSEESAETSQNEETVFEEPVFAATEPEEEFFEQQVEEEEEEKEEEVPASFENYDSTPVSFDEEVAPSAEPVEEVFEAPVQMEETFEVPVQMEEKPKAEMVPCPFCKTENEPQVFVCYSCRAMLTLSDVEMLLGYQEADQLMLKEKVEQMEIENSFNKFDAEGMKMLGIGLLNIKNLRKGFEYLQEAAQMNPNDVVLNSQLNLLAIRLSEIEEQKNNHDSMPKNKTILVVDDSATVRKLISGKLEKCGLEVICAVDGMDALEKINESIPDLILLDITMPRMDGYQVCKLIRGNDATKDVPVVMISGKDGFFDKVRGRMAGTTGYITKPFGPETLMKTVEAYIE